MTEKRFTSKVVDWWHNVDKVRVVFDNGEWIDADNCVKLLNALHKENQQLKSKNRGLQSELQIFKEDVTHSNLQINKLADENEQLKKLLECSREEANDYCEELMGKDEFLRLYKEKNEQLKKILNELSDMLQFDVENGIKSYPVKLSEYLSNALKELQK